MRIRKFNEQATNKSIFECEFIEKDGEIYISKEDIVNVIKKVVDGLLIVNDDQEVTLTRGQIYAMVSQSLNIIKDNMKKIGVKPNPIDPYNEEN